MTDLQQYSLLQCAQLCEAAYDGTKVGAHSYAVDSNIYRTVIAIAGTKNLENMLENASIWPRKSPNGYLAHAGVVNGFKELESEISNHVVKSGPVIFTGHSLGGGIAKLFAEKFNCEVVTFGCLKTYFRFYKVPKLKHTRVVCDDDPIPWVPGVCYTHTCESMKLSDKDSEMVDIKDHFINTYIRLLQKEL